MDAHGKAVRDIANLVRGFNDRGEAYRVFHGSSNSTRPRHGDKVVDISALKNVLSVNISMRTVLVEPNVPMDRLVEATLPHGLVPPVVMEFPGITAGGGYSGTSGESSSFRHGFFNDTINYVEMVLGSGEIVKASRTEREDLFVGAAGAAGTLGIVTLMELRLVEARKFVKTTYRRTNSVTEAIEQIQAEIRAPENDYIDSILFSKDHGVVITGCLTDEIPSGYLPQTFSNASDPWFYMHVQENTKEMGQSSLAVEYIPLGEYLFRYDRAGFWIGREGYTYFKYIPFNSFFRWALDDFSHTRMLYHALHASGVSSQLVVQDIGLPYETVEAFIDWESSELDIWPLWLCPLKENTTPTFHPVTRESDEVLVDTSDHTSPHPGTISRPMLSIGLWGWGPLSKPEFIRKNQELELKLSQLGGRKWLYAHTYYTEEEFWNIYDRNWYQSLRQRYSATGLPTIYDKVKVDIHARKLSGIEWLKSLTAKWPLGGLYGMWLAYRSKDHYYHRYAQWRYLQPQGEFERDQKSM
ncbi:galactose-1-phosphate uridylyltransferase [Xylariales sp. PMI_506]|nr:galactose-1-phosphate uridylyltransferase [Xylariales sp. PMI_506]